MTKEEFLQQCSLLPGASLDCPFRSGKGLVARHRASRRWFALLMEREGRPFVNLKCDPMKADFWRRSCPGVHPGWHMDHLHWNSVCLQEVPDELVCEMLRDSYRLTAAKQDREALLW